MTSPRDLRRRIKSDQRHGADHQGHADGGGVEDAQGPAGRHRGGAVRAPAVPHPAQRDDAAMDFTHPLLEVREVRKRAVILVAADKGLCGALNTNVFRLAAQFDPASRRSSSPPAARPRSSSAAAAGSSPRSSPTATRRRIAEARAIAACARDLFLQGEVDEVRDRHHALRQHADPGAGHDGVPAGRRDQGLPRDPGAEAEDALARGHDRDVFEPSAEARARLSARAAISTSTSITSC